MSSRDYIFFILCSSPSSYWETPHRDVNKNCTGTWLSLFMMTHQQKVECVTQSLKTKSKVTMAILGLEQRVENFLTLIILSDTNTLELHHGFTSMEPNMFQMSYLLFSPSSQNHFNRSRDYYFYCKRGHIAPGSLQRSWSCAIPIYQEVPTGHRHLVYIIARESQALLQKLVKTNVTLHHSNDQVLLSISRPCV